MAYNVQLEQKIDAATARWKDIRKKKMFGGVAYLLSGNMCVGIWRDSLIVRMDKDQAVQSLNRKYVRPFDITGASMAGWIMVEEAGWRRSAGLSKWLMIAKKFVSTLPEKRKKTKKTLRDYKRQRT